MQNTYVVVHGLQVGVSVVLVQASNSDDAAKQAAQLVVKAQGRDEEYYEISSTGESEPGEWYAYGADGDLSFGIRVFDPRECWAQAALSFATQWVAESGCP